MEQAEELKQLGNNAFAKGHYGEAIDLYSKAIEVDPASYILYSNRSAAHLALQRDTEALSDAEKAIALNSDWAKAWHRKGVALGRLGKLEDSYQSHLECLALDPLLETNKEALAQLVSSQTSAVRVPDTNAMETEDKEKGAEDEPASLSFTDLECTLCKELFYKPVALPCGHTFCLSCINHFHHNVLTEDSQNRRWKYECPCPTCIKCHRVNNRNPCVILTSFIESYLSKENKAASFRTEGLEALWSGNHDNAVKFLSQALEILPTSSIIWQHKAKAHIALDQPQKAVEDAQQAIKCNPRNSEAYFQCGKALYIIGNHQEALPHFLSALCLLKDDTQRVKIAHTIVDTLAQLSKGLKKRKLAELQKVEEEKEETEEEQPQQPPPTLPELMEMAKSVESSLSEKEYKPRELLSIPENDTIAEEFQCLLCLSILFQPVTTVCGHTFCRVCLARALDHNNLCPHCRASLSEHISMQRQDTNTALSVMLKKCCPNEWEERNTMFKAELEEQQVYFPIFVCNIMYPGIPCPLHIFEPRYRLMIRSVMESGYQRFGMCVHTPPTIQGGRRVEGYAAVGTTAEVKEVQMLPDGRSLIKTVGGRRFQVQERSVRHGYNVAKVEWFDDFTPEEETAFVLQQRRDDRANDPSLPELSEEQAKAEIAETLPKLIAAVRRFAGESLLPALGTNRQRALEAQLGPMPEDDTHFSYWMANILPFNYEEEYQFLQMRSQLQRYAKLFTVIQRLNQSQES